MSSMREAAAVRGATIVLLAAGLGLALAPAASAAGSGGVPEPVPAAELAQARGAVQSPAVLDQVGRFFARKGAPSAGRLPVGQLTVGAAEEASGAAAAAPRLAGDTVPVYLLDADFVSGSPGAPVARAEFTASKVVAADGQVASVWTVKQNDGWRVVNIATGGDESDYAARAVAGGGGTAFREPQINAWYVLRDGRVLPLDDEARRSVGEAGVSLAAYQGLVRQRYGDKLPGSAYDRAGKGGGYEPGAAQAAGSPADGGTALPAVTAAAALGVTALAGAGLALRRRAAVRAVNRL
ncbi:hypothetical protein [Kitasatospora purpeofusca]|uniref:hypothetical protein n=1 Tax=Kitasatospora purpeofusca TaxID=67352 RepID=UPI002A5AE8AC|nr:hypothetical protein [Kitasatospora purpeofusca]MDY0815704.1 hypothetical protein [Kitasatospora purpeofusca]